MRTKYFITAALAVLVMGGMAACSKKNDSTGAARVEAKIYHCPMHPQYTSDKPGNCPICQMQLVPINEEPKKEKILYYRNPMNPEIKSPVPTKDEMGMDYVPVYETETSGDSSVAGRGMVRIQQGSEQQMGVNVSTVEKRELFVAIKAPSRVAYDPNLYSAILEYQEALKARGQGSSERHAEAQSTIRASKLRLRQMGLSDQQIAEINQGGFDPSNLLLGKSGGKIWVYMDVYDYEAGSVKSGQHAEFTSPAFPGQSFAGLVRAVDSIVNSETRTLRVRVEVPNPKGELKPEMYLSGTILAALGNKLSIPDSAVLDTGMRQLAFVQTGPGQYEPREIKVGREASGYYEVISGVKEGEMVVTSANFFIDSESKIRAAAQGSTTQGSSTRGSK